MPSKSGKIWHPSMKWMLTLAVCFVVNEARPAAERAATPADATVFIRLVGSVHVELEDVGTGRQTSVIDRIEIGTGSGFVISPHGYVLTNEHVVSDSVFVVDDGPRKGTVRLKVARIEVCFPATASKSRGELARCLEASVQSSDPALDLAVLFITASDLPYVALGDSDVVRSRQSVEALGYPFGRKLDIGRVAAPDLVPEISVSPSTISALRSGDAGLCHDIAPALDFLFDGMQYELLHGRVARSLRTLFCSLQQFTLDFNFF